MKESLEKALDRIKKGKFVMVYDADGREEETDLVVPSFSVTPEKVRQLRQDAGGLICVTVPPDTWKKLGQPYLQEVYKYASQKYPLLSAMKADDIPYDEISTFSLSVNHRDTFTGISDYDRALTISRFARLAEDMNDLSREDAMEKFGKEFRTPGHVFLLNATEGLVSKRMGHTELTTALLTLAGIYPSMTICEMLSSDGNSLTEREAVMYGEKTDIPLIEGGDIIDAWEARHGR